MSKKTKWTDITELLTDKGVEAIRAGLDLKPLLGFGVGDVLKFKQELSTRTTNLKVMRADKRTGKLWGQEVVLNTPDEAEEMERQTHSRAIRRLRRKGNKFQ